MASVALKGEFDLKLVLLFLEHDFHFFSPTGRVGGWVETPLGKFQLVFFVFLKPSLIG